MLHLYDVPAPAELPLSVTDAGAAISYRADELDGLLWEHKCFRHVSLDEMRTKALEISAAVDRFLADVCGEQ